MDPILLTQFAHLAMQRSPENLSCDGELSRRQIQSRHKAIMREWTALEKQAGRKVSLREVHEEMGAVEKYPPYYMIGKGAA